MPRKSLDKHETTRTLEHDLAMPLRERAGAETGAFGTAVRGRGGSEFPRLFHAMFPVIIPQTKHASSLATAATATFFFFPWRIIL